MTGTSANSTDDVSSEISLFRTIIFSMAYTAAILAYLIFVVAEGSIQSG
jgi:hypothetical protein